jgi:hypothetical protein
LGDVLWRLQYLRDLQHEKKLLTAAVLVLGGTVLASFCLIVHPTGGGRILLMTLALVGGAFYAYVYARYAGSSIRVEKSAIVGFSVGAVGAVICFASSAIILSVSGNSEVVFNLHSLNLAIIGLIQLAVSSGVGGFIVGILFRNRHRAPAV